MLAELALRALTPAAPMARRLGLLRESVALWSRGLRQRRAWAPHHARCRALIAEVAADLPQRRKALILGSGLVRDVPLQALCDSFDEVVLVDIVHLPLVRLKLWRQRKVRLLTRDLGGVMAWLAGAAAGRQDPLADLVADDEIDLVVSANLLSQLAWPVADWLEDHPAAALPADLPARCIAWHLADLARFRGRVCLISDVEMVERGRDGTIHDRLDLTRRRAAAGGRVLALAGRALRRGGAGARVRAPGLCLARVARCQGWLAAIPGNRPSSPGRIRTREVPVNTGRQPRACLPIARHPRASAAPARQTRR